MKILVLIILLLSSSNTLAHGGEDHGATTTAASPAVAGSQLKVVTYPSGLEVLVKYPAPKLDEPVTARLYFADYATNHPVNPTEIDLSFPGTFGAKVIKQPIKISDGIYEFAAVFVRDTNHTALLRFTHNESEQLASLSPFYAGTSAQKQLLVSGSVTTAEDGSSFPKWLLLPILIAVCVLTYVIVRRRKQVSTITSSSTTRATSIETRRIEE